MKAGTCGVAWEAARVPLAVHANGVRTVEKAGALFSTDYWILIGMLSAASSDSPVTGSLSHTHLLPSKHRYTYKHA